MSWSTDNRFAYNLFIEKHKVILILFMVCFAVLSIKLFYMQIIKGNYYRNISEHQRINTTHERAFRGLIYDTKGRVIVNNIPNYVALFLSKVNNIPKLFVSLRREQIKIDVI